VDISSNSRKAIRIRRIASGIYVYFDNINLGLTQMPCKRKRFITAFNVYSKPYRFARLYSGFLENRQNRCVEKRLTITLSFN
jgi:hypothetical protein